mgnify:CR=1 FL=1
MAKRPLYVPKQNVSDPLYTPGQEYMTNEGIEYRGLYHIYSNGQIYSQESFNDKSIPLIKFQKNIADGPRSTGIYFKLTGTTFDKHIVPEYFFPRPTPKDYERAHIKRYFCAKVNDSTTIIEINKDSFIKKNKTNKIGINSSLYVFASLNWSIAGPEADVRRANKAAINQASQIIPPVREYLGNLTEYYKN